MKFLFVLLFSCSFANSLWALGSMQSYIAKGQLLCGTMPANKVRVKLIDIDEPGFDDVMGEAYTEEDGTFYVEGKTTEVTPIDPVLKFYHDCDDDLPCQRRWKLFLPKYNILQVGENPVNKTLDIGIYNLEIIWHDEERTCVH